MKRAEMHLFIYTVKQRGGFFMPLLKTLRQGFTRYDKDGNPIKPRKDPERLYVILLQGSDEDDRIWKRIRVFMPLEELNSGVYLDSATGQYKSIHTDVFKELEAIYEDYDLIESQVLTNNTTVKTSISLYTFMRHVLEADSVVAAESSITIEDLNELAYSYGYDENQREGIYMAEKNM